MEDSNHDFVHVRFDESVLLIKQQTSSNNWKSFRFFFIIIIYRNIKFWKFSQSPWLWKMDINDRVHIDYPGARSLRITNKYHNEHCFHSFFVSKSVVDGIFSIPHFSQHPLKYKNYRLFHGKQILCKTALICVSIKNLFTHTLMLYA